MSDVPADDSEQAPAAAPPRVRRGYPIVAWWSIALTVAFVLYRNAANDAKAHERFDRVLFELQARYIVGAADLLGQRNSNFYRQAQIFKGRSSLQHLCFAVVAGELAGPAESLRQIQELQDESNLDDETAATARALAKIYEADRKTPAQPPPAAAAERVREQLGWFGSLALAPPDTADTAARTAALAPARRTAIVFLGAALVALFSAFVGLLVLIGTLAAVLVGALRPKLVTGSPYGGIYGETFAVWMVLFLCLAFVGSLIPSGGSRFLVTGVLMLSSLGALAWPVIRGVPWRVVRNDTGLSFGHRPIVEILSGIATYLAAMPFLTAGVIVMLVLAQVARRLGYSEQTIAHPLAPFLVESGTWGRIQAYLVACVVAPLVEETMFRGVLYRHLREATAHSGSARSVLLSALPVAFVFAVIHPQGWPGVPPLMGLAIAFCLARELRGNLLAAMVAHAIQNGAVTTAVILAAG